MLEMLDTVERGRERESNSKELSFTCDAQNTLKSGFVRIAFNRILKDKKDRLFGNIKVVM